MKIAFKLLSIAFSALLSSAASAAVVEETVEYLEGGVVLEGYRVYDDAFSGRRPGVLVVHQWDGLTNYEKGRARQLAQLGYNVFAADVYGKGIRPTPPDSPKEAERYKSDRKLYRERLNAGLKVLMNDPRTEVSKIAAVGYCFGGTGVLELARSGADIAGVVSFHGALDGAPGFTAKHGNVRAKVLVLHGAIDPFVPPAQVAAFENEFNDAGANWQLTAYSGAVHAFTQEMAGDDVSTGAAYNAEADARSWVAMKTFFSEIFSN